MIDTVSALVGRAESVVRLEPTAGPRTPLTRHAIETCALEIVLRMSIAGYQDVCCSYG
ncbi:hypothetical protein FHX44_111061 [Pseudonocardia hierapolitana]|uniref:Uncharacterized protein n=1 Tax=Pseudonocardia hierapolitana TaxID=1128676 RepID=A0A561SJW2_9PSEU|nr:hypothetical protein FHX44_111061 [Pseudonocardia hierapolitana]